MRRILAVNLVFGPQTPQDLEIPVHDPAALIERHSDRIELAFVPA